ncbi:1,4-alpha-glucan branching protein GlgB [Marinimicrobium sp. ABcell2]|uniref:1,4-alpha-glucan branching protein GlgB n=1 Tax=Marinimicrobium sp. ABcell2 TaxID=3069751 RepID=UPI0027AF7E73|nr:1,4-alpha-glucan branching protein GlgB [Marinimicrobium sp. ABcell2]MDQ2075832.1 1,4-alpha-glucan branching protein GlgB [Marinimicrobium sp. ABcell2]
MVESAMGQEAHVPEWGARALEAGTLGDPFGLLGPHKHNQQLEIRTFQPNANRVEAIAPDSGEVLAELQPSQESSNVFVGALPEERDYKLRIDWGDQVQETEDPYSFGLLLGDMDLHLIGEGRHYEVNHALGAHVTTINGVHGTRFAVWAPNAQRVSVVGDFNQWDGRRHLMRSRGESGVWEIFIPRVQQGSHYKYEILGRDGVLPLKADPVGWQAEAIPGNASIVPDPEPFQWSDDHWMWHRKDRHSHHAPISVYEVHVQSWRRRQDDYHRPLSWDELGDELIPYVQRMGFTHIELLPITAHPFTGSWGYQPIGLFAPIAECGSPRQFARFVDRCHQAGIGVITDWVPAHFPTDAHGLMRFDGTALYEHEDLREGFHQDWNTFIYNLGRNEVRGFLLANALHWLETYHIDGLRVDAVASMLYRDYSRKEGEWVPNVYGGRENLETIDFLRHLNCIVAERVPGAMMIAEESTAWPGVTHAIDEGGLGFSFKWNMGWMHDTLQYFSTDPIYRSHDHDRMTFGLLYAFSENYLLPLSHDEVVHGKASLLGKMPGDRWQQFANLRSYYGFMWGHPGKKLVFMGDEIAQPSEWDHNSEVAWDALGDHLHRGVQQLVTDLNHLYRDQPALHSADCDSTGFSWLVGDDRNNSVFAFYRSGVEEGMPPVLVVCNLTPVPREHYRIGVPRIGHWQEVINSDADCYGGSNMGNGGGVVAQQEPFHGQPFSVELTLPPLATVIFVYDEHTTEPLH